MKIIILNFFLIFGSPSVYGYATDENQIENVYIDALIQRYKLISDNLWRYIEENRLLQPLTVVDKIITDHQTLFTDNGLEVMMLNDYKLKFQFYYETIPFKNCTQEDQLLQLLRELQVPENHSIYKNWNAKDVQLYCVDRVTSYYKKKFRTPIELYAPISKVNFLSKRNTHFDYSQKLLILIYIVVTTRNRFLISFNYKA